MEPVGAFLDVCRLWRKQTHRNLTVFALLGEQVFDPDYLLLESALEEGLVEIRELGPEGSVPELRLVNRAERPVLIVEGEELVGAKQNRTVNVTILVAAGAELVIPVSCVEQGRWHYRSETFSYGAKMMHSSLRRAAQESVSFSLREGGGYRSDQGRVWDEVAEKAARMNVHSPTMAAAEVFERYEDKLDAYLQAFGCMQHQVGAVFAIDGEVVGLEAFGSPDTFSRFFAKLVKSYALDAIDAGADAKKAKAAPTEQARRFLASAAKAKIDSHRSVGLGETLTLESRIASGAALVHEERLLHLSAFLKTGGQKIGHRVGFQRYSRRRQRSFE
ncbi:MAG: hypothetical protein RBR20_04730 [Desulfobacterales bacterium]|jgi:hypothetical protein|nr:hypothetical protein [Desulfobacterales bacterium]